MFSFLDASQIKYNEPLSNHTTFGVGGACDYYIIATDCQIVDCIDICRRNKIDYFVIGLGSNLLVSDKGYRGAVMRISPHIEVKDNIICASAGQTLSSICKIAYDNGLSGLEWASGLPSTVGGAIYGNAGVANNSMSNIVHSVRVLDKNGISMYNNNACKFGYRDSVFKSGANTILSACIVLDKGSRTVIKGRMDAYSFRRAGQPKGRSAGCVFKNGSSYSAGQLIDSVGLKGTQIGGAIVSDIHANFVINTGNATASDIYALIEFVRDRVYTTCGIMLECEIQLLGDFG